jgi:hypothetical protein
MCESRRVKPGDDELVIFDQHPRRLRNGITASRALNKPHPYPRVLPCLIFPPCSVLP